MPKSPLSYRQFGKNGELRSISQKLLQCCREFRKKPTPAEAKLWQQHRNRKPAGFIVDFYCCEQQLALELDGGIHADPMVREKDRIKQKVLEENGMVVLRFRNEEIIDDLDLVLEKILGVLGSYPRENSPPDPPLVKIGAAAGRKHWQNSYRGVDLLSTKST